MHQPGQNLPYTIWLRLFKVIDMKHIIPIILIILLVAACATPATPTPATVTIYAKDQLTIVGDTIGRGDGDNYYFVRGAVKNIGDSPLRNVKILVTLYDSNDKTINTNDGYIDSVRIEPGATSTFKIYVDDPYQHGIRHTVSIEDASFVK